MIATNAFKQAVVGTYTASDTVIELNSISDTEGNADYLPDGGFNLILYDGLFGNPADANNAGDYEILECTGVNYATNEVTVVREVENTTAVTIDASSWQVVYGATVAFFAQFEDADATILKQADVVDTLVSTSAIAPLSANQGKELKDQLDAKGKVLQVVYGSTETITTNTTTTFEDTNLTATITPSSATSKIVYIIHQPTRVSSGSNRARARYRVMRDAVELLATDFGRNNIENVSGQTGATGGTVHFSDEDSPATTSAVTYKTQFKVQNGTDSETVVVQRSTIGFDDKSTIILMEIEA